MSTTLYRKYRPQTFADVVGQEAVVTALQAQIEKKKVGHAFIFAGGRGIGKTTLARIFAKELGVTDKDMYEIDAASYTSVENIRELREGVPTLPFESPYKVYILDEAHMLSKSAFNALLKTLEEPPAHVIFILATTELHKIPDTVQSRCEVYTLQTPSNETLAHVLVQIATKEGYTLGAEHADIVATAGDASFRDALSILQQVLALSVDKKVTDDAVAAVTHAPTATTVSAFVAALHAHDVAAALGAIQLAREAGTSMQLFAAEFLEAYRCMMLCKHAPTLAKYYETYFSHDLYHAYTNLAASDPHGFVNAKNLQRILTTLATIARSPRPDVVLEAMVLDLSGQ